jgi:poly(A) polymerase
MLIELADEELRPPRLLTGSDLIEMELKPGPLFSKILRAVEDAQLDGDLSTPEEARRFVLSKWGNPNRST